MIDYLERLFTLEEHGGEEKPEIDFRFSSLEAEQIEEMDYPRFAPESRENTSVSGRTQEEFQQEAVRRVERALSDAPALPRRLESVLPQELRKVSLAAQEPDFSRREGGKAAGVPDPDAGEVLERRLRRDSRRYDSGFFWY